MSMARNNSGRDYNAVAGNRFNLRAKTYHMIKRIDAVSNNLGALGEFLVTTWLGVIFSVLTIGGGVFLIAWAIMANNMQTWSKNIPAMILFLIGTIFILLNALMTNPSAGSQFVVSLKFVMKKVQTRGEAVEDVNFRPFRFVDGIDNKTVIETEINGKKQYIIAYRVKGAVSPITFENELNSLARADSTLLSNIERDTYLTITNSIETINVVPKRLPANATPAMIRKRDLNHRVTKNLRYKQQLKTIVFLSAPTLDILRSRQESIEYSFRSGLVIGYQQLADKGLQHEVHDIYG